MDKINTEQLKKLVSIGKVEQVINILISNFPNDNTIILIKSRLSHFRDRQLQGILGNEEIKVLWNEIIYSLLLYIDNIKPKKDIENKISSSHADLGIILTLIFVLGFTVFLGVLISKCNFVLPTYSYSPRKEDKKIADSNIGRKYIPPMKAPLHTFEEKKFSGFDNTGRKANYVIFIVRGFNWQKGEIAVSEKNGISADICEHLNEIGVMERINRMDLKGIVCLGNTSYEEDLSIPKYKRKKREEDRADYRAEMLSLCVGMVLKTTTPLYISNLGKYSVVEEVSTYQREILVVGMVEKEEDVSDEEALYDGLVTLHERNEWDMDIKEFSKVTSGKVPIRKVIN